MKKRPIIITALGATNMSWACQALFLIIHMDYHIYFHNEPTRWGVLFLSFIVEGTEEKSNNISGMKVLEENTC